MIYFKSIIIGKGDVGSALFGALKTVYPDTVIRDKWRFQKENEAFPIKTDYLHICFPYFDDFVVQVKKYQKQYQPKYTVIYSNVPSDTSEKCDAIHSSILIEHSKLMTEFKNDVRLLGGEKAKEVVSYFQNAGFKTKVYESSMETENKQTMGKSQGEMLFTRREILTRLIKENDFKSFCEVGCYKGEVIREVMENCNLTRVIAIDNAIRTSFKDPLVEYMVIPSMEAVKQIKDSSLDLVFIDADHRYEAVKEDIIAWLPKIRKGGILSGHDYDYPRYGGVTIAVDELLTDFELELDADGEVPTVKVWWKKYD